MIVVFDVREETFRLVPLPQDYAQVLDDYESDADCYPRGSARVLEVGDVWVCLLTSRTGSCYGFRRTIKIMLWMRLWGDIYRSKRIINLYHYQTNTIT